MEKALYRMQQGVAVDLRATSTHMVDVVPFQSDHVIRSGKVDAPVVVAVASG